MIINSNGLNIFTLSLRAAEGSVAISSFYASALRASQRLRRIAQPVPRNDILLNAFVLANQDTNRLEESLFLAFE
jgi:hypothetical protein